MNEQEDRMFNQPTNVTAIEVVNHKRSLEADCCTKVVDMESARNKQRKITEEFRTMPIPSCISEELDVASEAVPEGMPICPVCDDPIIKPLMGMSCGHTLCNGCCFTLENDPKWERRCPVCNEPHDGFVVNYALQDVVANVFKGWVSFHGERVLRRHEIDVAYAAWKAGSRPKLIRKLFLDVLLGCVPVLPLRMFLEKAPAFWEVLPEEINEVVGKCLSDGSIESWDSLVFFCRTRTTERTRYIWLFYYSSVLLTELQCKGS